MKGNYLIETRLIDQAGLAGTGSIGRVTGNLDELPTLPERIRLILNIISSAERKPGNMICFIMYDIIMQQGKNVDCKIPAGQRLYQGSKVHLHGRHAI